MSARHLGRLSVGLAIAVSVSLTGCTQSAPSTSPAVNPHSGWPPMLADLTTVWVAEPGIDVIARPVVVVRAYLESRRIAANGGSNDYLYPGFVNAVAPNGPSGSPRSTRELWPPLDYPLKRPVVGTYQEHVLRVDRSDPNVTVTVCNWLWGAGVQQADGQYVASPYQRLGFPGVSVSRFNLLAPVDPGGSNFAPQEGPSKFANTDVFGGWRVVGQITAVDPIGAGTEWPDFDRDMDACGALAPESLERRVFLSSGEHPRSAFPTLPVSPGWPVQSQ